MVHLLQEAMNFLPQLPIDLHLSALLDWQSWGDHSFLAQATTDDPEVLRGIRKTFDYFIKSGQVWALLVGLILGYILRGLTR